MHWNLNAEHGKNFRAHRSYFLMSMSSINFDAIERSLFCFPVDAEFFALILSEKLIFFFKVKYQSSRKFIVILKGIKNILLGTFKSNMHVMQNIDFALF